MRRWDVLVDRYLEEYSARGLSEATLELVRRELDRWGSSLKRRRPRPRLERVDSDLVIQYIRGRTAFHAKATVAGTISVLRGMGDFLVRQEIWAKNPLRWMRGPKRDRRSRVPRRICREAMARLWQAAATHRMGYHRHLWLAILTVLYGTGIRASECAELLEEDVDLDDQTIRVTGKGAHQRVIPLNAEVAETLRVYRGVRGFVAPASAFFRSRSKRGMSRGSIYERVRKHGQAAALCSRQSTKKWLAR